MNIRKPVDYTDLYAQLETALCRNKKQMDQYAAIGKAVALRSEKGAAVGCRRLPSGSPPGAFWLFSQEPSPDAGLLSDL